MEFTILVVDDEPDFVNSLKGHLALSCNSIHTASSGEEALRIIREKKVHIVLSDIKMPKMDGLTLLQEIRKYDFTIQVIMMTGYSTFNITLEALEYGATDYIMKPFEDFEEISDVIESSKKRLCRWRRILVKSSKRNNPTQ